MSQLALKLLLGIGSTGLACAIPVGMFYGIKGGNGGSVAINSLDSTSQQVAQTETQGQQELSPKQPKIACQGENGEVQMEYFSGAEEITPEMKEQLQRELSGVDGKCHKFPPN